MGTYFAKASRGQINWNVVDAEGWVLGRLAATGCAGVDRQEFAGLYPNADHRSGLIIINAEKIRLTGKKLDQKVYRHNTGYPGGLREISARKLFETQPEKLIREAIYGMLPKNTVAGSLGSSFESVRGIDPPPFGAVPPCSFPGAII